MQRWKCYTCPCCEAIEEAKELDSDKDKLEDKVDELEGKLDEQEKMK